MFDEEGGLELTATTTWISTIIDSPLTSRSCVACQQRTIILVWSNIKDS
jgi:hypothetical protein